MGQAAYFCSQFTLDGLNEHAGNPSPQNGRLALKALEMRGTPVLPRKKRHAHPIVY